MAFPTIGISGNSTSFNVFCWENRMTSSSQMISSRVIAAISQPRMPVYRSIIPMARSLADRSLSLSSRTVCNFTISSGLRYWMFFLSCRNRGAKGTMCLHSGLNTTQLLDRFLIILAYDAPRMRFSSRRKQRSTPFSVTLKRLPSS